MKFQVQAQRVFKAYFLLEISKNQFLTFEKDSVKILSFSVFSSGMFDGIFIAYSYGFDSCR